MSMLYLNITYYQAINKSYNAIRLVESHNFAFYSVLYTPTLGGMPIYVIFHLGDYKFIDVV